MDPITSALTSQSLQVNLASSPAFANIDGQGLTAAAAAGVVISHVIQPYMDKVPAKIKPLVPVAVGIGGSMAACMSQGMGVKDAFHYGLVTAFSSLVNHSLAFAKPAPVAA